MRSVLLIVRLVAPRWGSAALAVTCMVVLAGTTAAYAYLAGPVMGVLHGATMGAKQAPGPVTEWMPWSGDSSDLAWLLGGAIVLVSVLRGLASYGQVMWVVGLQQRVVRDLRLQVFGRLLGASARSLSHYRSGDLGARVVSDIQQIEVLLSVALAPMVLNGVTLLVLSGVMLYLDPLLALTALAATPMVAFVVGRVARRARQAYAAAFEDRGSLSATVVEQTQLIQLIRAYEAERPVALKFEGIANRLRVAMEKARRIGAITGPVIGVLGALALAAALVFASRRLAQGQIAPEDYVSFFAALFLMYRPVQGFGSAFGHASVGIAAMDRVESLLGLEPEPAHEDDAHVPSFESSLELRDIHVSYGPRAVLDGANLMVKAGETVAIAGPNGSGKTTLLMVILGMLGPDQGEIRMDGKPVPSSHRGSMRQLFSWVPQEPLLFADTILGNIALGESPNRERAERAAREAGAHEFISDLEGSYDAHVSEGGRQLSMGQRQRLCIARALYRDAPVLVLDEPTASLDADAERALTDTIDSLLADRTVLIVSHRETTLRRADRIVVLREGRIIARGTADELRASAEDWPSLVGASDTGA